MEEKVRLGNRDKGWNDPPSFAYNAGTQGQLSSPRRPLLNQRVAMPQDYSTPKAKDQSHQSSPEGLPTTGDLSSPPPRLTQPSTDHHSSPPGPPPAQESPLRGPSPQGPPPQAGTPTGGPIRAIKGGQVPSQSTNGDGDAVTEEEISCDATLARLQEVLEGCKHCLQKRVMADIQRRFTVLKSSWQNQKMSRPVQQMMSKLAKDLQARRYDIAHELHLSLMMNHISEVSQWMVGVKRLIQEARSALPPEEETNLEEGDDLQKEEGTNLESRSDADDTQVTANVDGVDNGQEPAKVDQAKMKEALSSAAPTLNDDEAVTQGVSQMDVCKS
ncbi:steroid receptor RNA activator 1-like [Diadema antillarum]|uniref:steroid receptor RNA activator 1-like n=1 Tax=Diadema antillarum TaxID=105358 RepID=UPI003A850858